MLELLTNPDAWIALATLTLLEIVLGIDNIVFIAIGMAEDIEVMVTAVVIAIAVMLLFAKQIGDFVNNYPSMKILALSFLLLIGVLLTAEGLGQHINKGYIYFAMAFSLMVELLNIRFRAKQDAA
jgi:predicted tellurium resistance membrane protein TerC